jgi:hypothetical protein
VADSAIDEDRPALSFLIGHWLRVLGSALVTIGGCSWLFLVVLRAEGRSANPYVGILIFFAIPAVFFAGLILIPIGSWLARRRIREGLAVAQSRRVVLRRLAFFFITPRRHTHGDRPVLRTELSRDEAAVHGT